MNIHISKNISAALKRSARRKTIALKVRNAEVTVYAPLNTRAGEIQAFVDSKAQWVEKHLRDQRQRQNVAIEPSTLMPGEKLRYLGQELTIKTSSDKQNLGVCEPTCGQHFLIPAKLVQQSRTKRKAAIAHWYLNETLAHLQPKIAKYAALMGTSPKGIKVRHYKSRWGSCNSRGELQFNWVILMAPEPIIDYVVIHELAHLKHFNHSQAFWCLVEQHMPDFQNQRAWLKNQQTLRWD